MKNLVTGASGFIASHLIRYLIERGESVSAWSRGSRPASFAGADIEWRQIDLTDKPVVSEALQAVAPDRIYHLSAQCLPRISWQDPVGTMESNVIATLNLLQSMQEHAQAARLILASSSSIYATSPGDRPIREEDHLEGASLYSVSKMAQELSARLWSRNYGTHLVVVRPFFVIGPEKIGDVCSDLARRIVWAERVGETVISIGNMSAVRDFLDIDDAVVAFTLMADKGERDGVYNLSRGAGWSVRDVLDCYRELAGIPLEIRVDPDLIRPIDEPVKIGDSSKLQALGWKPTISVEDSLRKILDYWRAHPDE